MKSLFSLFLLLTISSSASAALHSVIVKKMCQAEVEKQNYFCGGYSEPAAEVLCQVYALKTHESDRIEDKCNFIARQARTEVTLERKKNAADYYNLCQARKFIMRFRYYDASEQCDAMSFKGGKMLCRATILSLAFRFKLTNLPYRMRADGTFKPTDLDRPKRYCKEYIEDFRLSQACLAMIGYHKLRQSAVSIIDETAKDSYIGNPKEVNAKLIEMTTNEARRARCGI